MTDYDEKTKNNQETKNNENYEIEEIIKDYSCYDSCRVCPFPGAKCQKSQKTNWKNSLSS